MVVRWMMLVLVLLMMMLGEVGYHGRVTTSSG
jgi:hypothetical protein